MTLRRVTAHHAQFINQDFHTVMAAVLIEVFTTCFLFVVFLFEDILNLLQGIFTTV